MIVVGNNTLVDVIGCDAVATEFRIKPSAKAFKTLSDGLYKDKVMAPVRELIANAWDSHIKAGKTDVPIEIHLPNILEPYFYVRDRGVGLSQFDSKEIFTTYFESTKTENNDETGCLGLGSKSPYAYNNLQQYSVTSIFNGIKYFYSCFLDGGKPKILELLREETDECNGVEVRFDVRKEDFELFLASATIVLFRYPYYQVLGRKEFQDQEKNFVTLLESSKDSKVVWRIFKNNGGDGIVHIVQGHIAYKLEPKHITFAAKEQGSAILGLRGVSCDITVPIGSVDFVASREALSYDQQTIKNLKAIFELVVSDVAKEISKKIEGAKTRWEAVSMMNSVRNIMEEFKLTEIEWQGQKISTSIDLPKDLKDNFEIRAVVHRSWYANPYFLSKVEEGCIVPKENTKIWIADARDYSARLLCAIDKTSYGEGQSRWSYRYNGVSSHVDLVIIPKGDSPEEKEAVVTKIVKALGDPPTEKISTLPSMAVRIGTKAASVPRQEFYRYNGSTWRDACLTKVGADFDPINYQYYFFRNRSGIEYENNRVDIAAFLELLKHFKIDIKDIVFVTKSFATSNKAFKSLKLTNILDAISGMASGLVSYNLGMAPNNIRNFYDIAKFAQKTTCLFERKHVINKISLLLKKIKSLEAKNSPLASNILVKSLGIKTEIKNISKIYPALGKSIQKFLSEYPMIRIISESSPYDLGSKLERSEKIIADYIKMVDKTPK
jgi:hypothetical protein